MLIGCNMSYAYRAPAQCARPVMAAVPCAKPDPCAIPQHTETVTVPHHKYTLHSQTFTRRWVEHTVEGREIPVTQEQLVTSHPPQDICVGAPKAAPVGCAPRLARY